jgi:pyruvate dehydrogenase E1 component alpha subunit
MRLLRAFEDALLRQPKPGFQLLSRGEEAIAVGICSALEGRDLLLCSGRSIGPALARGVPPKGLLAEVLGKDGGPNRGRAGRGHVSMPSIGFFGAHAVVAGNLTIAAGVALAQLHLGTGAVTVCMFGDGACGSGTIHETLNIASLWKLPLVLACSNNGLAVSTPVAQGLAPGNLCDLALPFGIPAFSVDGSDVDRVAEVASRAVAAVRSGNGPCFLELRCARLVSHSTASKDRRSRDEMQRLAPLDPIPIFEQRLRAEGLLDDRASEALRAEVGALVAEAESFVASAPWPDGAEAVSLV